MRQRTGCAIWRFAAWLVVWGLSHAATASVWHVSNRGTDSSPGTSDAPWQTLARAAGQMQPGDTLLLERGSRWEEQLLLARSGTASAPVTVSAYGSGELPEVRGNGAGPAACKLMEVRFVRLHAVRCTGAQIGLELYNSSDIVIDGSTFDGNHDRNVMVGGTVSSNLTFTGNAIHDAPNDCWIDFAPGDNIVFADNDVARCVSTPKPYGAGVRVVSDGASEAHRQTHVQILRNRIHDHGAGSGGRLNNTGNCLHLDTVGDGLVVRDNIVSGCEGDGLELEWAGASGSHVIERNTAFGNRAVGIVVYRRSHGVQVLGNTAYRNGINFEGLSEYGQVDAVGMVGNVWKGNFAYAPLPGGKNIAARGGAANDGVNGSGNVYVDNCWGMDRTAAFRWGNLTTSSAAQIAAVSGGALRSVCGADQRRTMREAEHR